MITHLRLKAYGKINLALDVLGKRQDGYHEVQYDYADRLGFRTVLTCTGPVSQASG